MILYLYNKQTEEWMMAITYNDRKIIEKCLQEGKSSNEIALIVGCTRATVYNEIHRGEVLIDDNGTTKTVYSADEGQKRYEEAKRRPRENSKIYRENAEQIEAMLKEGRTVKEISENLPVEPRTIYNYINNGKIPGIDKEQRGKTEITMFNNGTVTIPKWLRSKMKLSDGQRFHIEWKENEIKLLPIRVED